MVRCRTMSVCIFFVMSGERRCLCFVCRASFVRVLIMTESLFLYVVFCIFARVWGSVYVSSRMMLNSVVGVLLSLLMIVLNSTAVAPLRLLLW